VGKGTHAALDRATEFSRRFPYVLKCDIEHFFPNIDHAILYAEFKRLIADPATLRLCKKILDSGADVHAGNRDQRLFPDDDLFALARPLGLPIGNLTSQFWANVYLNPLDQYVKQELKCRGYCRYVDDFILFSASKEELHSWRTAIIGFLSTLRLTLHEPQAAVFPVSTGIPFLGWRIYPHYRRLKRSNGVAFQRRYAQMRKKLAKGSLTHDQVNASVQSWVAHVAHGNTWRLRSSLFRASLPAGSVGIAPEKTGM
jgi:retron-type reverse transcriptase